MSRFRARLAKLEWYGQDRQRNEPRIDFESMSDQELADRAMWVLMGHARDLGVELPPAVECRRLLDLPLEAANGEDVARRNAVWQLLALPFTEQSGWSEADRSVLEEVRRVLAPPPDEEPEVGR